MAGTLEVYVGGMYAEKSTNLIRQGKRHLYANRKVVFLKPFIDNRYKKESVCTHSGTDIEAFNVLFDYEFNYVTDFTKWLEVKDAEVICIDEIQFFPEKMIERIEKLIYEGKKIYVAGLDLDRYGKPFGIVPYLMAKAEVVKKFNAVCVECGADAWVTVGTDEIKNDNQVNVGNDYKPLCRSCAEKVGVK